MIYLYLFGTCFHFIYVFMIIGNNNAIINRYACRIAELENVSLQERQAKQEEIGILNRKILCLIAEK